LKNQDVIIVVHKRLLEIGHLLVVGTQVMEKVGGIDLMGVPLHKAGYKHQSNGWVRKTKDGRFHLYLNSEMVKVAYRQWL
jgi:hypothetical protein